MDSKLKREHIVVGSILKTSLSEKMLLVQSIHGGNGNPIRYHCVPVAQKQYQLFCPTFNQIQELIIIKQ